MGVSHDGCGSARQADSGQLMGCQHGAFNVDMSINKPGTEDFAGKVSDGIRIFIAVLSHTCNFFIGNENIDSLKFI